MGVTEWFTAAARWAWWVGRLAVATVAILVAGAAAFVLLAAVAALLVSL